MQNGERAHRLNREYYNTTVARRGADGFLELLNFERMFAASANSRSNLVV